MIKRLQQNPLFVLLLPVFFVFHGFVENYSFIRFMDCGPLFGIYIASAVILYGLGWLLLRNKIKAALFSSYIMSFYLFFGALHDFLRRHALFLHKYSILLSGFVLLTVGLILYLKRSKSSFIRVTLFLNTLLLVYILVDTGNLAWKNGHKDPTRSADRSPLPGLATGCDSCSKPDIYFILFDCYSGNTTLKDVYHYDNSAFHRFLQEQGFHLQKNSRSNYAATAPSMASMLNLSYLGNLHDSHAVGADEFADIVGYIGTSRVVNFLHTQGYTIVNESPFDLPGNPSSRDQGFIPVKTRLITNRTLWNYMMRDLHTWIVEHLEDSAILSRSLISEIDNMNSQFLAETKEESHKNSPQPRFIYTHVFMPHFPFFYDSMMRRRSLPDLSTHEGEDDPDYYLQYLPYTNSRAKDLISTIKRNTGGKAVIIFMSDHGLRSWNYGARSGDHQKDIPAYIYNNQNAVYFPDGNYSLLYDSISGVNQFRVVFNQLFHSGLPLLKDSTVFLTERTDSQHEK